MLAWYPISLNASVSRHLYFRLRQRGETFASHLRSRSLLCPAVVLYRKLRSTLVSLLQHDTSLVHTNWLHSTLPNFGALNQSRCATSPRTFTSTHRASTRVRIFSAPRWTETTKIHVRTDLTSVILSWLSPAPCAAAESIDLLPGWASISGHACSVKDLSWRGFYATEGTRRPSSVPLRINTPQRKS